MTNSISVKIWRKDNRGEKLPLPTYATSGAAAMDLMSNSIEVIEIPPMQRAIIPTGVHVAVPEGHELQVRSRSGFAAKHSVFVLNGVGTIDSDYRGEIGVILFNLGVDPIYIRHKERIAQAIVSPVLNVKWEDCNEKNDLGETQRNEGKYGSTGRK